jgi:hypothetical protein
VPCGPGKIFRLYLWLATQRRLHATGKLRHDRRERLVAIGVELERPKRGKRVPRGPRLTREQWDQRFQELAAFKARFGHCSVPVRWPENPALANWTSNQRQLMAAGRIDAARRELLMKLGVVLGAKKKLESWASRYQALLAYKARHGDCNVPGRYAENPSLGIWVANQRHAFAQDKLPPERLRLLEKAGFVFRGHAVRRDLGYLVKTFCRPGGVSRTPRPLPARSRRQGKQAGILLGSIPARAAPPWPNER